MTCSTIFNLIVVGGFGIAIIAGVMTETLLAKAGYKPKNYLAEWLSRVPATPTPLS